MTYRRGVRVRIECFGEPRVTVDGERLDLRGKQPLTLATLVAHGPIGLSKIQLYHELYIDDEELPTSGAQSALMLAHRLAKKINPAASREVVVSKGPRLALSDSACSVDVWEYEAAVSEPAEEWLPMLESWAEPYAGLSDPPPSVQASAERLRRLYRRGLARAGWIIDSSIWSAVFERLLTEVANDPFDEDLIAGAAVALYRRGQQTDALDLVSSYRTRLNAEHGLLAGEKIDEVELAILNHEVPSLVVVEAASVRPTISAPTRYVMPDRFLGSCEIVASIEDDLDRLMDAEPFGGVRIVRGEGGYGKTTLLARVLAERQADGLRVLTGSARTDGGIDDTMLFRPFLQAFSELAIWIDEHGERADSDEQVRLRLLAELASLIEGAAAQEPLVLVLEDMHEADSATVSLLRNLVGADLPLNLLLIIATRNEVAGTPWADALRSITAQPHVAIDDLIPFRLEEVRTLVAMDHPGQPLMVRERFAIALAAASHGNPLVTTVLSRDAVSDVELMLSPESVNADSAEQAYVSHIVSRIADRDLDRILLVAALIGLEFDSGEVALIVEMDSAAVESKLENAARLRLCERRGLRLWRFDHLLTAAAISYAGGFLRPLLFAKLARAGTDNPVRLLRYVRGAGPELDHSYGSERLQWAASSLESQGAYEESALAWLEVVARLDENSVDRLQALVGAGAGLSRIGRRQEAASLRAEAIAFARRIGDHAGIFRAALAGLPSAEYVGGEEDRLDAILEMTDEERAAVSPVDYAKWCLRLARLCERNDVAAAVAGSVDTDWPGTSEQKAELETELLIMAAEADRPERVCARFRELAELSTDGPQKARILHQTLLSCLGEQLPHADVIAAIDRATTAAEEFGSPRTRWSVDVLAVTLAAVGVHDSDASPTSARSSGYRWGISDVEENFMVQSFMELWMSGQVDVVQAFVAPVEEEIDLNIAWKAGLALSAAVNGDEQAHLIAAGVAERLVTSPGAAWSQIAAALLAETAVVLDEPRLAETVDVVLKHWSGLAIVLGTGSAHFGPADRYLGLAAAVRRDRVLARRLLTAALHQAVQSGASYWEAQLQLDLANVDLTTNP